MRSTDSMWQLHRPDRYDDFASSWDRINESAGGPPFLRSLFIRNLLTVFGTGNERLAAFGPPGEEQALCLVAKTRAGAWQTWQPSQLPLGAWVMSPALQHDDVLGRLLRVLPGFTVLVAATQQDPAIYARPSDSARMRTVDYIETAWVPIAGSFETYWSERGKQLRENMRKQRSRLERDGVRTCVETITDPKLVGDAIADFGRLESAGWKGKQGTAVHPDNDQGRFYRATFEDYCRSQAARIYRYRFGERVVAVDLCVESADVQVLLKTTYDESLKGVSPSSLLRQDVYRQIFEEGRIRRIEFYGRVMEWTKRWTHTWRTLYHVNRYRSTLVPAVASVVARGIRMARSRTSAGTTSSGPAATD